ncbi:hypothetical protein FGIG_00231 [Fasciola gigantica]|uniref:Uncharacterized protein n=1 Tax=Fasciola gigantica TaxID=46835 RepID=A0A504YY95_FASGI|nr:hypothetical protein FGIG_00231 [Fasciola gigantica]
MNLAVVLGLFLVLALANASTVEQDASLSSLTPPEFLRRVYMKLQTVYPKILKRLAKNGEEQHLMEKFQNARTAVREAIWAFLLTVENETSK